MPQSDEVVYVVILLGSVLLSGVFRLASHSRADLSAASGIALLALACGTSLVVHPCVALLLAVLVHWLSPPQWRGLIAMVVSFGHLGVVRLLPKPVGGPTNAALLILVLRAVSGNTQSAGEMPRSAMDFLRYMCCYHGLFTAPVYTYGEWRRAMSSPSRMPAGHELARDALKAVTVLAAWRGLATLLPFSAAMNDAAWVGAPMLARPVYFYISSFQFRFRFYACWCVMEISAKLAGFEDASNVIISGCELATSPSTYIASWNTSVQQWLKTHVYRQLPRHIPRPAKQLVVFGVSSFWHGVHPGYYLCFLFMFVMVTVEQMVRAAAPLVHPSLADPQRLSRAPRAAVAILCHLWTMWSFSFSGVAFNLLRWSETFRVWASLGYYGVWLTALPAAVAATILVGASIRRTRPASQLAAQAKVAKLGTASASESQERAKRQASRSPRRRRTFTPS
jgi:D-alanyl-lipoteichoic acid acyltransferase DltB (MBOAT superfamily)